MIVVGCTGQRRAGKDSIANRFVDAHGFVKVELPAPLTEELLILDPWCRIPDVDGVNGHFARLSQLVEVYGIDRAKDISPDVRAYQQRYGTDIVRDRIDVDRWVKLAIARIEDLHRHGHKRFVIPNIRAANERALCDFVIRVRRPGHDPRPGDHRIEQSIEDIPADVCIENDRSLAELHRHVDQLATDLLAMFRVPA